MFAYGLCGLRLPTENEKANNVAYGGSFVSELLVEHRAGCQGSRMG